MARTAAPHSAMACQQEDGGPSFSDDGGAKHLLQLLGGQGAVAFGGPAAVETHNCQPPQSNRQLHTNKRQSTTEKKLLQQNLLVHSKPKIFIFNDSRNACIYIYIKYFFGNSFA